MSCDSIDFVLKGLDRLQKKNLSILAGNQIEELMVWFRFIRIFTMWRPRIEDFYWIQSCSRNMEDQVRYAETQFLQSKNTDVNDLVGTMYKDLSGKHKSMDQEIYRLGDYYLENYQNTRMSYEDVEVKKIMVELIIPLQENLKYLLRKGFLSEEIKKLEEKLRLLTNFLKVMEKEENKIKKDIIIRVQVVVENALVLSFLCSAKNRLKETYLRLKLFDLLLRIKHVEPDIRTFYVEALKASKTINSGAIEVDVQAVLAVDSLLDDLTELLHMKANRSVDQIEVLFKELRFLKDFLMDPHLKDYMEPEKLTALLTQIEDMAKESKSVIHSFFAGQLEHDVDEEKSPLPDDLLKNVNFVKAEIRQIYLQVPKPPLSNYPKTQKLGFLESFLESFNELLADSCNSITFVTNDIKTIQSELGSMRCFLGDVFEHCKEAEAFANIEHHLTSLVYEAECLIDLIIATNGPVWYYVLWLSDVTQEIILLKTELSKMDDKKTCDVGVQTIQMVSDIKSSQNDTPVNNEMVGFKDQSEMIKNQLLRGSKQLDVVSIIGMPGLGKTTLAKNVYDDPAISFHFHVRSWCCVSQVYGKRRLLLDILDGVVQLNAVVLGMTEDSLADMLYKNLKGRKYLIILDDIWNKEAWNDLRSCFPDDHNGSRIMLTSRFCDVALLAKPDKAPFFLRLFSEEESWELLQKKVFQEKSCPPELCVVGKKIAEHCRRLPLSVVVVAGLLKETDNDEHHWEQIAESLGRQIIGEPGKGRAALELSYQYLPYHLKPCFLYLGIFPEDKAFAVQKLLWLWIAEGFVCSTAGKCLEDVAEGYLVDLINRSLVIVAQNRCIGGVKTCCMHDLLREFCLQKAKEENFLLLLHENEKHFTCSDGLDSNVVSHSFHALSPEQHRMCIHSKKKKILQVETF